MAKKLEYVGVRLTRLQRERLLAVASEIGSDGNLSAGFRWVIKHAPVEKLGMKRGGRGQSQRA